MADKDEPLTRTNVVAPKYTPNVPNPDRFHPVEVRNWMKNIASGRSDDRLC